MYPAIQGRIGSQSSQAGQETLEDGAYGRRFKWDAFNWGIKQVPDVYWKCGQGLRQSLTAKGVPNEFKAWDQVAAGFESFLCWWCTINKNTDWINYIYYNQQRFIDYTVDAVEGLAEQLQTTTVMSW